MKRRLFGYLWWRGRVLQLYYREDGCLCAKVPRELTSRWHADKAAGRINLG